MLGKARAMYVVLYLLLVAFVIRKLYKVFVFIRADADLVLLRKGAPNTLYYKNKVVWITGASQGLGAELACQLAAMGAQLILSARNEEGLRRVKDACPCPPSSISLLPLDLSALTTASAAQDAVQQAEGCFGGAGVDILIHNAAYARPKSTCEELDIGTVQSMFQVNVLAPISLSSALLPKMLTRKAGQFVVISSAAGKVPSPLQAAYAATKQALHGFFHTLHYERSSDGIHVCVVCPGPVATAASPELAGSCDKDRMTSSRCASLILTAASHKLDEAWIAKHPVLLVMYLMQYLPALGRRLMRKVGPKRVQAFQHGSHELYSANILFQKSNKQS